MAKAVKKVLIVFAVLVMSIGILCACDDKASQNDIAEKSEFFEPVAVDGYYDYAVTKVQALKDAYKNQNLNREDLQAIANCYNAGADCDETLSADVAAKLKEVEFKNAQADNVGIDVKAEDITIKHYYGNFNGYYAVMFDSPYYCYPTVVFEELVIIGQVRFYVSEHLTVSFIKI